MGLGRGLDIYSKCILSEPKPTPFFSSAAVLHRPSHLHRPLHRRSSASAALSPFAPCAPMKVSHVKVGATFLAKKMLNKFSSPRMVSTGPVGEGVGELMARKFPVGEGVGESMARKFSSSCDDNPSRSPPLGGGNEAGGSDNPEISDLIRVYESLKMSMDKFGENFMPMPDVKNECCEIVKRGRADLEVYSSARFFERVKGGSKLETGDGRTNIISRGMVVLRKEFRIGIPARLYMGFRRLPKFENSDAKEGLKEGLKRLNADLKVLKKKYSIRSINVYIDSLPLSNDIRVRMMEIIRERANVPQQHKKKSKKKLMRGKAGQYLEEELALQKVGYEEDLDQICNLMLQMAAKIWYVPSEANILAGFASFGAGFRRIANRVFRFPLSGIVKLFR